MLIWQPANVRPSNPKQNYAYLETDTGDVYIYDRGTWIKIAKEEKDNEINEAYERAMGVL